MTLKKTKKNNIPPREAKVKDTKLRYSLGLPKPIATKIYKTSQTRGAEKDTVYQNRVSRCSTVLIPISLFINNFVQPSSGFERGYIVLASPEEYFSLICAEPNLNLSRNLKLGDNLLVLYETRYEWDKYSPNKYGWHPANSRTAPLGGEYIARVPDTTRSNDSQIRYGYTSKESGGQGAGIRFYEYASREELEATMFQLAFLAWQTEGIINMALQEGVKNPEECQSQIQKKCQELGLADIEKLQENRIVDQRGFTVCPLCLERIKAMELANLVEQAEGRNVPDLTVTEANLFHVEELKAGHYNHKRYNLGWGHHHCNATARDFGIDKTLQWMEKVLRNNGIINS